MMWQWYHDPVVFAQKTEPDLYKHEDKYSLFLGVLGQIRLGRYKEYIMGTLEEDGRLLAACLMTPPHPLQIVLFEDREGLQEVIAEQFIEEGISINEVVGERVAAEGFAAVWTEKTGREAAVLMDQGLYRLDSVTRGLAKSPGTWQVAGTDDAPLLEDWFIQFHRDVGLKTPASEEAAERIAAFLKAKEVYLWEVDGVAVSCMKRGRPSKHGVTVSFVFTPEEHRRKGYARSLVAEVSEELLETYDFCMLYTDLLNPTSNKIYREIGYQQIANPVHLTFTTTD
ncbi:GNAT family N-acetyltransferase [Planococcus lenghuensis]|uniref:GNAT family N-acetyltransferase n=1 Tax=Planococcus lenghuensis TaxID=2213202 RepID=A0A1Q2KV37_9BACL|nr:GNAT family N-acetyltransferase [Planococcus lenghuensis]AQQ52070.1 GNAT family N-acetyltransferase [Planococcus lenghuensis]